MIEIEVSTSTYCADAVTCFEDKGSDVPSLRLTGHSFNVTTERSFTKMLMETVQCCMDEFSISALEGSLDQSGQPPVRFRLHPISSNAIQELLFRLKVLAYSPDIVSSMQEAQYVRYWQAACVFHDVR